jgi:hypothetical protein
VTWSLPIVGNGLIKLQLNRFLKVGDTAVIVPLLFRKASDVINEILKAERHWGFVSKHYIAPVFVGSYSDLPKTSVGGPGKAIIFHRLTEIRLMCYMTSRVISIVEYIINY